MTTRVKEGVIRSVTTRGRDQVISPGPQEAGIPAVRAHELAGISYRQLDHWARQGWVKPSLDAGQGRSGRRIYSLEDVIRLDLLRHLTVSGVNPAVAGPAVADFPVPDTEARVLWGPMGTKGDAGPALQPVAPQEALHHLELGGAYVVYNPQRTRAAVAFLSEEAATAGDTAAGEAPRTTRRKSA